MRIKPSFTFGLLACAVAMAFAFPKVTQGDGFDPALPPLVDDLQAQQKTIADNQAKIDAKLATIAESLRQAKIYVSRGK